MNSQLVAVRQRRGELLARIEKQREQVAVATARWQHPLALADKGVAVTRFLRSNPWLLAGVSALMMIRRRSLVGLGMVAWKGWKLYRSAKSFTSNQADNS